MIASDSIRHADVVSQVISWLEAESEAGFELPGEELLKSMLALEDSANEANLRESIKVDHPVARLLLEWIDMDEAKHGKMVARDARSEQGSRAWRPLGGMGCLDSAKTNRYNLSAEEVAEMKIILGTFKDERRRTRRVP